MNDTQRSERAAALSGLLAAQRATRAAAAAADRWLDLYRRAANRTLDEPALDGLLREALGAIARILDADAVSLLLANDDGTELIGRAAFGLAREVDLSVSIPAGAGVSGPILANGEPRIIADLQQEHVISDLLRSSGQRAFVGVPLRSDAHIFGVLHATRRRLANFTPDDIELLTRFAEPIAAAIERVRLFEAERAARRVAEEATERVRALQRITAALASAATEREICQLIVDEAVPGTGETGETAIWVLRDARLLLVAGHGLSAEYPEIPLDPSLPAAQNLREGKPLFVESRSDISRQWPILSKNPTSSFAGLPLLSEERRLGVMAIAYLDEHKFNQDERQYLIALAEQAAAALARAETRVEIQTARQIADDRRAQLDFLAEASKQLSGSLDLDVTLQAVAALGVPKLADRCALFLLDGRSITNRVLAPDLPPDEVEALEGNEATLVDPSGVGAVIRTGKAEYVPEVEHATLVARAQSPEHLERLRRVGIGGVLILPLRARGRILGALSFVNRAGRRISVEDRALAEELSARAALAIDNALLYRREAHIASHLTASLLPSRLPAIAGIDIGTHYEAGSTGLDIGGDFYDFVPVGPESWLIAVGDVQGKGVEAAAITGLARHTIRASARYETSPAALLKRLNTALIENIIGSAKGGTSPWDNARLCTAVLMRLDHTERGWTATISCAGHPLPLLRRANGSVAAVSEPAMMLGVLENPSYEETALDLEPHACLVLYTDGVSDRTSGHGRVGSDGIASILQSIGGPAQRIADAMIAAAPTGDPADDLVVLCLQVRQSGDPSLPSQA